MAAVSAHLTEFFGEPFIRWVFNIDAEVPLDGASVDASVQERLAGVASPGVLIWSSPQGRSLVLQALWELQPSGWPLLLDIRAAVGGATELAGDEDPLASSLVALAVWSYPLQLLERSEDDVFGGLIDLHIVLLQCPALEVFKSTLRSDVDISRFFPETEGEAAMSEDGQGANVVWNYGQSGTTQLGIVPFSALTYLFTLLRLDQGLEFERIPEVAVHTVSLMRQIARDGEAHVRVVAALSQLEIEPSLRIDTAEWSLVAIAGSATRLPGANRRTRAALITECELKLIAITPLQAPGAPDAALPFGEQAFGKALSASWPTVKRIDDELRDKILRARLALALSSPEGGLYAPFPQSRTVLNPFTQGPYGWASDGPIEGGARATLDAAAVERVKDVAAITGDLPTSMAMGARRIVAATAERAEPMDAFVDAVVCWENLFGTDAEVSFRVCGSIASLLEPADQTARLALFKELKTLYGVRSRLLHGAKEPTPQQAVEHRDRALRVGLRAFELVLRDPALRALPSSGDRSQALLLGR